MLRKRYQGSDVSGCRSAGRGDSVANSFGESTGVQIELSFATLEPIATPLTFGRCCDQFPNQLSQLRGFASGNSMKRARDRQSDP